VQLAERFRVMQAAQVRGLPIWRKAETHPPIQPLRKMCLAKSCSPAKVTTGSHKVWGDVVYVRLQDGRGAVWTAAGDFITFLERYSPKQ
jgi:hypothetical protein